MSQLETECLKISAHWVPLEVITVRQAFSDAAAGAAQFLRFIEGYPVKTTIEEWMDIDPEEGEDYVTTSRLHETKRILVPRVEIAINYGQRPKSKEQPCTSDNLLRRYGGKDAVTGKPLSRHRMSREHKIPRSKGGKNGWENEVPMDRELNSKRGNKDYSELGLSEPKILPPPRPLLPINMILNKKGYPEWDQFGIPRP